MKSLNHVIFLVIFTAGCASTTLAPPKIEDKGQRVSVMTFNVENLFDTEDDPEIADEAFLPLSKKRSEEFQNKCRYQGLKYKDKGDQQKPIDPDAASLAVFRTDECLGKDWSPKVLARKMHRLTDVVKQVNNGKGPDILLLQEVENRAIVERWRDEYLKEMGYQTLFHIDSPDERGIDTAILTRFEAAGPPTLHLVDYTHEPTISEDDRRPTRGILEGRVKLPDGHTAAIFSVHLPSQGAASIHRSVGLKTLMAATAKVPAGISVIVGGDFNITSAEEFKKRYYKNLLSKDFAISHKIGCKGCVGSTYYGQDDTWSFFDVLLFAKPMLDGSSPWQVDPDSIRLVNSSRYQIDNRGKPAKFRTGLGSVGVSDHWPVYAEIFTPAQETAGAKQ